LKHQPIDLTNVLRRPVEITANSGTNLTRLYEQLSKKKATPEEVAFTLGQYVKIGSAELGPYTLASGEPGKRQVFRSASGTRLSPGKFEMIDRLPSYILFIGS
jgi:hypothetical protein